MSIFAHLNQPSETTETVQQTVGNYAVYIGFDEGVPVEYRVHGLGSLREVLVEGDISFGVKNFNVEVEGGQIIIDVSNVRKIKVDFASFPLEKEPEIPAPSFIEPGVLHYYEKLTEEREQYLRRLGQQCKVDVSYARGKSQRSETITLQEYIMRLGAINANGKIVEEGGNAFIAGMHNVFRQVIDPELFSVLHNDFADMCVLFMQNYGQRVSMYGVNNFFITGIGYQLPHHHAIAYYDETPTMMDALLCGFAIELTEKYQTDKPNLLAHYAFQDLPYAARRIAQFLENIGVQEYIMAYRGRMKESEVKPNMPIPLLLSDPDKLNPFKDEKSGYYSNVIAFRERMYGNDQYAIILHIALIDALKKGGLSRFAQITAAERNAFPFQIEMGIIEA